MKKKFLLVITFGLLMFSLSLASQTKNDSTKLLMTDSYQIAVGISDVFFLNIGAEATFYFAPNNYLGLRLSPVFLIDGFDEYYNSLNWGGQAEISHRYYIPEAYDEEIFYFLRSSLRFTGANLNFSRTDWFPFDENGLELLNYETRSFEETVYRADISFAIGLQVNGEGSVFGEMFVGLRYGGSLNSDNLRARDQCLSCGEYSFSIFTGNYVLPFLGVNIGFGKAR